MIPIMFIRVKNTPNSPRKSVQLVESYRNTDGNVRQRIVRHIGIAGDDFELEKLKDLGEYVKATFNEQKQQPPQQLLFEPEKMTEQLLSGGGNRRETYENNKNDKNKNNQKQQQKQQKQKPKPLNVDLRKIREEQRVVLGIHEVAGTLYRELGFAKKIIPAAKKAARKNLYHITMARLANPGSKRSSVKDLAENFGVHLGLQSVYRMMDAIDDKVVEKAGKCAAEAAQTLLGEDLNLILYDCTTLYFESFTEDDLKKNGYSKDMKFNQPQIVLGLLATRDGLPIGYEVFPGNTFEGHTLPVIIERLRKQYSKNNLSRVIFVADSAMLSRTNLDYLDENAIEYIVSYRIKSLNKTWRKKVQSVGAGCCPSPSSPAAPAPAAVTDPYQRIGVFDYTKTRRLIVTYREKRALKDCRDRETGIERLRKKLGRSKNPETLISNYGYKRFIKLTGDSSVEIDERKCREAARWDGLHGIITNAKNLSAADAVEQYHKLWQIEDCFRISKHDLRVRPIFHWTPARIRAHILICFLSLVCIRHLAYRVSLRYPHPHHAMSAAGIIRELSSVQASILHDTSSGRRYVLPSPISESARKLYTTVGLTSAANSNSNSNSTTPYELTSPRTHPHTPHPLRKQ